MLMHPRMLDSREAQAKAISKRRHEAPKVAPSPSGLSNIVVTGPDDEGETLSASSLKGFCSKEGSKVIVAKGYEASLSQTDE